MLDVEKLQANVRSAKKAMDRAHRELEVAEDAEHKANELVQEAAARNGVVASFLEKRSLSGRKSPKFYTMEQHDYSKSNKDSKIPPNEKVAMDEFGALKVQHAPVTEYDMADDKLEHPKPLPLSLAAASKEHARAQSALQTAQIKMEQTRSEYAGIEVQYDHAVEIMHELKTAIAVKDQT